MGIDATIGNTAFSSGFSSGLRYIIEPLSNTLFIPDSIMKIDTSIPTSGTTLTLKLPDSLIKNDLTVIASVVPYSVSILEQSISTEVNLSVSSNDMMLGVPDPAILIGCCTTSLSASYNIPDHTVSIVIPDWDTCSSLPNDYWDNDSDCKDNDKSLYNSLQMQLINSYGSDLTYYSTDYNTDYDKIFGEDMDRHVLDSYDPVMATFSIPEEQLSYEKFGIFGIDEFHIFINKTHFEYATSSYDIKRGDLISINGKDMVYEIMSTKDKVNQFMQEQYTWDLTVRPFRDNKLTLSPNVSASLLSAYVDTNDILEVNTVVDNEVSAISYNTSGDSKAPPSDWW